MPNCILTTEYDAKPITAPSLTDEASGFQIPDDAIARFAKFLYPRFLAAMEQQHKEIEA